MTIDPGRMNDRITLQKRAVHIIEEPYYHEDPYFQTIATVWAQFRPTGGREFRDRAASGIIGEEVATFTIMYRENLTQVDRLVFKGLIWEIKSIARVGFKEALDLNCTSTGEAPEDDE